MNIATGLGALKAATDMARILRDRLKSEEVKPDEVAGRIGEIYDYIVDSKDALVDAKDEVQEMKDRLRVMEERLSIREMPFHDGAYWLRKDDGAEEGPFCPSCWSDGRILRAEINSVRDGQVQFYCKRHQDYYYFDVPEPLVRGLNLERHRPTRDANVRRQPRSGWSGS
jgi:hypothetical protein